MRAREKGKWSSLFKIFRFAKRHWFAIAVTLGCMGAFTASEGAYLLLMKPFLEVFLNVWKAKEEHTAVGMDVTRLYQLAWRALALGPIVAVFAFGQDFLKGWLNWRLVIDLRNAICRAVMPQSLSFFENRRSGDLLSRITNDVARAQNAFGLLFGGIPQSLMHLLLGLGVAAYASWQLLGLGIVVTPLLVLPTGYLVKRIRRYGREGLEKLSDLTDLMSQMFSGIRVIKAFKMEDVETQEFERGNARLMRKMTKMNMAHGLSYGNAELIPRLFIAAAVFIGASYIGRPNTKLDIADLALFIGASYFAFNALRKLVKAYNQLHEWMPATDRILELLEYVPSVRDAEDALPLPRLERGIAFENVTFGYDSELVLHDISFDMKKGETVALVGRSGSGKSTIAALIPRFYEVTSGAVKIDGTDVRKITRASLLDRFSIVTQQTFLFNRSVADNIRYGRRDATQEEVEQAARAANIHDFIASQPEGYSALCGEFGAKLSGGQRQRIAIARAILKNADILILDEAMAGLDAESESLVREALANLMRGRTTLVITHDLPTIRHADRILVLKDGRLVGQGTHAELMAEGGEYSSLYAFEFGGAPPAGS
jgi:subfamily B ATP-binding cassette protein MsbA